MANEKPAKHKSPVELLEQAQKAIFEAQDCARAEHRSDADFESALDLASGLLTAADLIYCCPNEVNREPVRKMAALQMGIVGTEPTQVARKRIVIVEAFKRWAACELESGVPGSVADAVELALNGLQLELRFDGPLLARLQDAEGIALARSLVESFRAGNPAQQGKACKALLEHAGIGGTLSRANRTRYERTKKSDPAT